MQELNHSQFLNFLRQRGIEISVKDGHLRISAPPGAVDPQLHEELVRRKPGLLEILQVAHASTSPDALKPMERHRGIPQTPAQQGMWLIDHLEPGNVAYNIPEAFVVEGPIDTGAFQKAVDGLLKRHETLRTAFYEEDGELLQSIHPDICAQVGFTDLSMVAEDNRQQTLRKLIQEHGRQPFELDQPPLVRFHLFRLAEQRHVVFFNIHHIIADQRSLNILREELSALYQAAMRNESARLPDLPVQYADYAIWVNKHLANGAMADQIQYWRTKLAGVPPFLDLPSRRLCSSPRTALGATVPVVIPGSLLEAAHEIGRQEGATIFMTFLAAFSVLLYKDSGKEDFCIGSPFTHRNQVETEPLIGLFVNMLAFRCQMTGEPSFREVLKRVRSTALEAYERSDVPFQEVVRALKPDPRSERSPIFQIMFGFNSDTVTGQIGVVQIDTQPGTARFDLTLQLSESSDGVDGSFEYCTDLFEAASIERLSRQFVAVLDQIVQNPDRRISSIEILEDEKSEPERVLDEGTDSSESRSGWMGRLARRLPSRLKSDQSRR